MKRIVIFTLSLILCTAASFSQEKSLKGDGQVFWQEDFDWEDASAERGWTLPEGWIIEDNSWDDTGFTWVWTKDSMQGPLAHRDGGYILNSTTGDNGFLAIDLDSHNAYVGFTEMLYVNSSITLPVMDCSSHPSVIISLEQMFKYFNSPKMAIEVSNDDGAHWAEFDLKMGTGSATNTMNLPNDEVAYYTANLSAVAGGQSAVIIKITWDESMLYFWMLDDITLREGWDYDLKMKHWNVGLVDENIDDAAGFYYMMPKTQILPLGSFEGSVVNYGDYELTDVHLDVVINKNGNEEFSASSEAVGYMCFGDPIDTLAIEQTYTPVDFGHYEVIFSMLSDQDDQFPDNNVKSHYFHVTDSVFARTPDVSEADESPWRNYFYFTHEGDFMGVEFDPIADCEASSISAYISRANIDAEFRYVLLEIIPEGDDLTIVELIYSDIMYVDSTILEQGWVTLPLEHDGIGEDMKAGSRYIAAVQFWAHIEEDDLANRDNSFWLGSTESYPASSEKQWGFMEQDGVWVQGSDYSKMIRLNINNHENIIDGLGVENSMISLDQNYPNPLSSQTRIQYELVQEEIVTIEITDITGRIVMLIEEGVKPRGKHAVLLSNLDLESGLYSYTLKAGKSVMTRRMMVSK
ncbi:MAG: T9SS type A sorting domain-containing protein [Bacteroidales bacterium]|nr:T9SS type A sorting domain-containing protein [Bacteroidales bacterium]